MARLYDVTIRTSMVAEMLVDMVPDGMIMSITLVEEDEQSKRRQRKVRVDNGSGGRRRLIELVYSAIHEGNVEKNGICKILRANGYSETSYSPTISRLVKDGKIKRVSSTEVELA